MDTTTKSQLNAAYTMKVNCASSSDVNNLVSNWNLDTRQKGTLLNTWTFLRVGMGLIQQQAAGVCGNLYAESKFSEDNAQDSSYPGIHNSNYVYSSSDSVGYGLMQWTYKTRKEGLTSTADSMGLAVSDINAQLAYFRKEMTTDFKSAWTKIKAATSYNNASDIFLEEIEKPAVYNYNERRGYSQTIYNALKSF